LFAGRQPDQDQQLDQLPLGATGFWRQRTLCLALVVERERWWWWTLFPRWPRFQRICLLRTLPALAAHARRYKSRRRARHPLGGGYPARGPGGWWRTNPARRPPPQPHAVDTADLPGHLDGRL